MNKTDLVAIISERSGVSRKDTGKVLDSFTDTVTREIKKGGEVRLVGFGKFVSLERKARVGRNPSTGESIPISACKSPKFIPGKGLKDAVR